MNARIEARSVVTFIEPHDYGTLVATLVLPKPFPFSHPCCEPYSKPHGTL